MRDEYDLKDNNRIQTIARLEGGSLVPYDCCSPTPSKLPGFYLLGTGVIHSIGGVLQYGKKTYFFYRRV